MHRFAFILLLLAMMFAMGFFGFIASIPEVSPDPDAKTDAIVVLTGSAGRLERGLALLEKNQARILYISGVGGDGTVLEVLSHAHSTNQDALAALKDRIQIGTRARTTFGNAAEVKAWVAKQGVQSLRLVTSNYHIPRSMLIFSSELKGVKIIPEPASSKRFSKNEWFASAHSLRLALSEYYKFLLTYILVVLHAVV